MSLLIHKLDLLLLAFISYYLHECVYGEQDYFFKKRGLMYPSTHMLVLAVEVSHSPTSPTMSNPVDS